MSSEPLSGTKLHQAMGTAAGAAVEAAVETANYGGMGLRGVLRDYGNTTAMVLICIGMSMAFMWLRADAKEDRQEYRLHVIRAEQLSAEQRREDRQDRQNDRDVYRVSLEGISRDNRDMMGKLAAAFEQMKMAGDQMKLTADAMGRIEKLLTAKQVP
jgi:hypothetical protein